MSFSDKEWPKVGDDAVHKIRHTIERFNNRLSSDNLRLSERYINAELKLLLSGSFIGRNGNICNFIAEFQRARFLPERNRHSTDISPPTAYECRDSDQESMFVSDVEFMEIPKRVVSSRVRLYRANDFFRARSHHLYFSLADGRCIFLGGLANRKIGISVRGAATSFNKLPNKMVEGTSQIMNGIAEDQRDFVWDGTDFRDIKRHVLNFRLFLDSENIRLSITEGADLRVQNLNVLFGPFNFESDSVESIHASASLEPPASDATALTDSYRRGVQYEFKTVKT